VLTATGLLSGFFFLNETLKKNQVDTRHVVLISNITQVEHEVLKDDIEKYSSPSEHQVSTIASLLRNSMKFFGSVHVVINVFEVLSFEYYT
jgi:hypothetical protein